MRYYYTIKCPPKKAQLGWDSTLFLRINFHSKLPQKYVPILHQRVGKSVSRILYLNPQEVIKSSTEKKGISLIVSTLFPSVKSRFKFSPKI